MSLSKSPIEYARHVVDSHTRGAICPAEVWHQFVDHATPETFSQFMSELTPELQSYFRHHVLVHYPEACTRDEERRALSWLSDYYAHNLAEPGACT